MAGNALGIVFSLLLLASIIQGLQDVELFHHPTLEAVVGQNITLPCLLKKLGDLKLVGIEWKKKEGTKVAVYSSVHGQHLFWPNVTIQTENSEKNELMGSYLHLPGVNTEDSGIYTCEITSFPFGSILSETKVTVKDDLNITCNVDRIVEIPHGENATICCAVFSTAQYRWTKDKELVSETEYLELWQVTDAHAGVYKLTVNAGDKSLHKDFIITVLTATTSLRTDPVTVSPEGLTKSAHSSPTQSLTTGLSTHVDWTTHPNASSVAVTAAEHTTPSTISTPISVTSSPATHSGTHRSLLNLTTSSNLTTPVFRSTQEMARDGMMNESTYHTLQPEDIFSVSTEESSTGGVSETSGHPVTIQAESSRSTVNEDNARGDQTRRGHVLLVLIIIPLLLLIVVIGFLYWRQIIKRRMDLPPPFKPPPPPIKYTAARQSETWMQSFPISRCNSVAEPKEMKQTFV